MAIRIVTDSGADISKEDILKYNIYVFPFYINFEDESFLSTELPNELFYQKLNEGKRPQTGQLSPTLIEEAYREIIKSGDSVIHVTLSSNASGAYEASCRVAQTLAEETGADITVIDSQTFALGYGHTVVNAAEMAQNGASKDEIINYIKDTISRTDTYFIVDDLTALKRGGRIRATTAVIAGMLGIKPILKVNDGLVEAFDKVRGMQKALEKLVDFIEEKADNPAEQTIIVADSCAHDRRDCIAEIIRERINPKEIVFMDIGPTIGTHAGAGAVAVSFLKK